MDVEVGVQDVKKLLMNLNIGETEGSGDFNEDKRTQWPYLVITTADA